MTINVRVSPDSYKDIGEVLIITSSKRFAAASRRPGVTWLEGVQLIAVYLLIAIAFYFI